MILMNSIFTRRSVRKFNSDEVEIEKIDKIIRAGMQAPSAMNGQPWNFLVIRNKSKLQELSKFSPYSSSLAYANVGILVMGNSDLIVMPEYLEQDLSAATQNILLEITELNLGGVWYGLAPDESKINYVANSLNLGSNLLPFSIIGIGYCEKSDANRFIDRYDKNKIKYID